MPESSNIRPCLRPVEAFPVEHENEQMILIQDPTGLATAPLVISRGGFFVVGLLDGKHTLEQIQVQFLTHFGRVLPREQLEEMVGQLDAAHYLATEGFAAYYDGLVANYRAAPVRAGRDAASFGADDDGLDHFLDGLLGGRRLAETRSSGRRLAGLVAPHLDYPRGRPCYAAAYGALAEAGPVDRVVILGTNHFGQGPSAVATGKDFETPLGVTPTDRAFLDRLQNRLGVDLCQHEFDHLREHSVELQVVILQHLLGADRFKIVPVLCPDPCGPNGTAPYDGQGVDLHVFGETLGALVADDEDSTLIVAGADLSHFGWRFGDNCELDVSFLADIERKDREALGALVAGRSDLFLDTIRGRENDTRICSAGCIYALTAALPGIKPELLGYHQAVDRESGTAVSCTAMAMWRS
jgi:AmmeMemoRadiSam system protein B